MLTLQKERREVEEREGFSGGFLRQLNWGVGCQVE
jgi:hypothetical protein